VKILIGLLAFVVSYSSVYVLNDLFDIEDDKKDETKVLRKPLAKGVVNRKDAVMIFFSFLISGLVLSILFNMLFFCFICLLLFLNVIYSIPLTKPRSSSMEYARPRSLKHTILGLPLVLLMQLLKVFLPWTISSEMMHFPTLFVIGLSLIYCVLFKGYKEKRTIGSSIKHEPLIFSTAIIVFLLSMSMYPQPILQASILIYLLVGILFFRNSYLIEKKVLILSPIYIFLGIIFLFYLITVIEV
jgi:hypothetical protein